VTSPEIGQPRRFWLPVQVAVWVEGTFWTWMTPLLGRATLVPTQGAYVDEVVNGLVTVMVPELLSTIRVGPL
jgi:hypothetical protein